PAAALLLLARYPRSQTESRSSGENPAPATVYVARSGQRGSRLWSDQQAYCGRRILARARGAVGRQTPRTPLPFRGQVPASERGGETGTPTRGRSAQAARADSRDLAMASVVQPSFLISHSARALRHGRTRPCRDGR